MTQYYNTTSRVKILQVNRDLLEDYSAEDWMAVDLAAAKKEVGLKEQVVVD